MGIDHELAKAKLEEFAERGKRITYKLAWYITKAESLDSLIWLMLKAEWSKEEIIAFWDISDRFFEISMKRHSGEGPDEGKAGVLEQIAEVRAKKFKDPDLGKNKELFEKDSDLRLKEKLTAVEIFLEETQYSPERIAELVGVSVSFVKNIRKEPSVK